MGQYVGRGDLTEIRFEKLMRVFGSALMVRVLLPRPIHKLHILDVVGDFAIIEECFEIGIFKGIVVREGYFVDVVGIDEFFLVSSGYWVVSSPTHSQ